VLLKDSGPQISKTACPMNRPGPLLCCRGLHQGRLCGILPHMYQAACRCAIGGQPCMHKGSAEAPLIQALLHQPQQVLVLSSCCSSRPGLGAACCRHAAEKGRQRPVIVPPPPAVTRRTHASCARAAAECSHTPQATTHKVPLGCVPRGRQQAHRVFDPGGGPLMDAQQACSMEP
jgi:hypothetical protein